MEPKQNSYVFSKEDFASVCFLETRVPLMLSCRAAKILKSLFTLFCTTS
jgi:hypothetical protein